MSKPAWAAPAAVLLALFMTPATVGADGGEGEEAPKPNRTAEVRALVDELMPEVARLRGLEWKRPVPAFALPREELAQYLLRDIDEDYPPHERERDDRILHRLGYLAPDEASLDLAMKLASGFVSGFYDPKRGELYLVEGPVGEAMKPTLVHELTHALDDQHFDLDGLEERHEDDPDRFFAGRCLFEGCAVRVQQLYEEEYPHVAYASESQGADDESLVEAQQQVLREVPAYLVAGTFLHYRVGPALVGQGSAAGFPEGMAALWANPPTTQEHFLHPERWLDPDRRDLPRRVQLPDNLAATLGPDWTPWYAHSLGELDLALNIDFFLGEKQGRLDTTGLGRGAFVAERAHRAASGWDGGRVAYFDRHGKDLVVVQAVAFDSEQDAREAFEALLDVERVRKRTLPGTVATASGLELVVFENEYGTCWIGRRGQEILQADGVPPERLVAFVEALQTTTFTQLADDRGDASSLVPPLDPLAGCVAVNSRRGLGLRPPPLGWKAVAVDSAPEFAVIHGPEGTRIRLLAAEQGLTRGSLPHFLENLVEGYSPDRLLPGRVAGLDGHSYVIRRSPWIELRLASDGVRTFVGVVQAGTLQIEAQAEAIQTVLDSIVSKASY
ncbi:MAG: hypothetical protein AB7T63_10790 [Planctomycetota bacterium]